MTLTGLVTSQPDPVLLWHWRLGHLSDVIPVEFFISSLDCESCELGKHHRATFQNLVNNHSSFVLSWSIMMSGVLVVYPLLRVLDIFCSLLITSLA